MNAPGATRGPLVGRQRLVARAEALLDGDSRGIVLVGEAGVGKSHIASEVMRLGDARGYATASTVGTQAATSIPLGALSHLLPDLADTGGNVLVAARTAFANRAGDRRLMLSIDDAHLLDNHSAALVLQLAMSIPSFVVATIRAGEPVPDPVVALWKEGLADRVEVGPLDEGSIGEIVTLVLAGPSESELTRTIVRRADGNPLVARELCLGGLDSGVIQQRDGRWALTGELPLSTRLVELVASRVEGLGPEHRQALDVIAHGEPLGVHPARQVVSAGSLIELERRGLVMVREDGRRREVWLSHPFYADVVRATAGPLLAASIKGALAAAVAAAGMRRRTDLIQVATWQLEAGVGDLELLLKAAHETYRARDMASTARLAAGAWDIRPDATAGLLLGTAVGFTGRHLEADAILGAATELATTDHDYARLVLAHSSVMSAGLGQRNAAIALLAAADERVTDHQSRAMLRAQRAHLLAFRGEVDETLELAEPIIAANGGAAMIVAATAATIAYNHGGAYRSTVEVAQRVLAEHDRLWAAGAVAIPPEIVQMQAEWARVLMGELDAAASPDGDPPGGTPRSAENRPIALLRAIHAAGAALLRGRPREAETIIRTVGPASADPLASSAQATLAHAVALTGRVEDAGAELDLADASLRRENRTSNPMIDEARAWTLVARGRPHEARETIERALEVAVQAHRWGIATTLAHDLARLGAVAKALAQLDLIGDRVDGPLALARRAHVLGLSLGDAERLDAASRAFAELGADLLAAEAAADAGRAARRSGEPRRANLLFRRAADLVARCEGARTPALVMPDEITPLSSREREVAGLAAAGLASEEIAGRLFLSVRTVDNHLQHVYQKLGIGSRAELSAAMTQSES